MATSNAFAVLRDEDRLRRREQKSNVDSPEEQAPATTTAAPSSPSDLSNYAILKGRNWADISEDEDDGFYDENERRDHFPTSSTGGADRGLRRDGVLRQSDEDERDSSSASSSSESSEDDDEEEEDAEPVDCGLPEASSGNKEVDDVPRLSKKDRKQKEMAELGAALAEFGMKPPTQESEDAKPESSKKKKRPKKVKSSAGGGILSEGPAGGEPKAAPAAGTEGTAAADLAAAEVSREEALHRLKEQTSKGSKKVSASSGKVAAAVLAEAKKRADGKKTKTKKSERNQQYQR